jgi:mRNA interferase MazF
MSGPTVYDRFTVAVVPFPYADQLAEKRRPALVISSAAFQVRTGLVWVAMITSAINARWQDDVVIADHNACGLPAPSVIRPAKIATIDSARFVAKLGMLTQRECGEVARFFTQSFA